MSPRRTLHSALQIAFACAIVCMPAAAAAQESWPTPAHVVAVQGAATVEHAGELIPAAVNLPIVEGDRIRTGDGNVEVLLPDGSSIDIDPDSDVQFLWATRVRVIAGAIEHRPAAAPDPGSPSGRYLPQDLQAYAPTFDESGSWQYDAPYGYVWYPAVAPAWRPYYYGYWSSFSTFGWTWIGIDAWSWPTHHFGRWGFARDRWFWIPGRTWAPAWVAWAAAPGYVSWCPLGFDSRPVFALSAGYSHTWRGWTVVPRDEFGVRGRSAHRIAIEPQRLAADTPFIVQRTAPASARGSVTRGAATVYAAPPQNAGARRPSPDYRPAATGNRAVPRYAPPSSSDRRPPTDYRPPATDYRAMPRYAPPSSSDRRPPTDYRPPATDYRAVPRYAPPSSSDRRPPTDYRPPATDYRAMPRYAPPQVRQSPPTAPRQPPAPVFVRPSVPPAVRQSPPAPMAAPRSYPQFPAPPPHAETEHRGWSSGGPGGSGSATARSGAAGPGSARSGGAPGPSGSGSGGVRSGSSASGSSGSNGTAVRRQR